VRKRRIVGVGLIGSIAVALGLMFAAPQHALASCPAGSTPINHSTDVVSSITVYCGGVSNEYISLLPGDKWTDGEVTAVPLRADPSGPTIPLKQRGALECQASCSLYGVKVHDVPNSFAAFAVFPQSRDLTRVITIEGGEFDDAASIGLTMSGITFSIQGAEIAYNAHGTDGNGASVDCGFEAGGIKWVGDAGITTRDVFGNPYDYGITSDWVHDNGPSTQNCPGVWSDIHGTGLVNNVSSDNNSGPGIQIEISANPSGTVRITHSHIAGNGYGLRSGHTSCSDWYWNPGILLSTTSNVEVDHNYLGPQTVTQTNSSFRHYGETLTYGTNCSGLTAVEQLRCWTTKMCVLTSPDRIYSRNINVHDNQIDLQTAGTPKAGFITTVSDDSTGFYDSSINHFENDTYAMSICTSTTAFGWMGALNTFSAWQNPIGMDIPPGGSCNTTFTPPNPPPIPTGFAFPG